MPGWLLALLQLFAEVFLGFLKEQGRQEVREEVQRASEGILEEFREVDGRDDSLDDALGGLRKRSAGHVPVPGRK